MEIKDKLYLDKVEQDELELVFLSFFGHGEQISSNEYVYRKTSNGIHFITLTYNSKGKIQSVISSKDLSKEDINALRVRISDELIKNQDIVIAQKVCFSHRTINGYLKYMDLFQLLPVPDHAPKIPYVIGNHPILLEYQYTSSPNSSVNASRKSKRFLELILLIHFLSKGSVFSANRYMESAWVLNQVDDNDWSTSWKQLGYNYEGFTAKTEHYTSTNNLNTFPTEDKHSNELTLLSNTPNILEKVFLLDKQTYQKFIRCLYWYYTASQIWKSSHSASYVFLLTSIECLLPKIDKCKCGAVLKISSEIMCEICREPKYGIGKNLKEFFEKHGNDIFMQLTSADKSRIYNVRSKMVHGANIYERDIDLKFSTYAQSQEDSFHRMVNNLVSESINSWINSQ